MINLLRKRMLIPIIALILIILAFILDSPREIWEGYLRILTSPSILVTDYITVGGIGATFINAAILLILGMIMLLIFDLRVTGPIFAGLMTIAGFAFFGKNLLNVLPVYMGIFLYTRVKQIKMRNVIIVILFSTGIAPVVSYTMFGLGLEYIVSIPLGIFIGLLIGFSIPTIASNTIKLHSGFNLYNVGFALGIVAMVFTSIYRTFGLEVTMVNQISTEYHYLLMFMVIGISLMFIIAGFLFNKESYKRYPELLKSSGRLISDYIRDYSIETTMLNVGILGIISVIASLLLGIQFNGPIVGVIFTVMGFASFGKHARNVVPVMIGAIIITTLANGVTDNNLLPKDNIASALAIFLVTGIAPISGRYGWIAGVIAGMIHIFVVQATGPFQGGFDLYNNGFAAGFVAAIMIPVLETFEEGYHGFKRRKENREDS